jgi:hypothetical protein
LLLAAGALCPACLILDPTQFPAPEDQLPTLLRTEPSSADVQVVDRTETELVELAAFVFDANEEDVLAARGFVDWSVDQSIRTVPDVQPAEQGDPRERIVTARFNPSRVFTRGCHVVEIDVIDDPSGWSAVSGAGLRDVQPGVGKATATWFVLARDGEGDGLDDISLASCPGADRGAGGP